MNLLRCTASCVLVCAFMFATFSVKAETNLSGYVRIRLFKDLPNFPMPRGVQIKTITENFWSLRADKSINYLNKKLPTQSYVLKKASGLFDIIGVVDFEDYLAGVVASEMPLSWPLEALKAQAVVARSYTLARIRERQNKFFQLESDQGDQVYTGKSDAKARQAVLLTHNIVLTDQNGQVIKAYYHSDCGGHTVKASDVWGANAPDFGTAADPWCALRSSNAWSFAVAKDEFMKALGMGAQAEEANLREVQQFTARPQVIPVGDSFFSVQKLREIFGFSKVRSSIERLEVGSDWVTMSGRGFGHGVGLCQWGTRAQVKLGKSYFEVLKHYYPLAKIDRNRLNLDRFLVSN